MAPGGKTRRSGDESHLRLIAAFYRQVPSDDILGPMYPPDDLASAERRLRDFLIYRFGGPTRYIEERGNPRLRIRHAPFVLDQAARDRWVTLMDRAFVEVGFDSAVESVIREFLAGTATFLMNR